MTDENPKTTLLNLVKDHFNKDESSTRVFKNGSTTLVKTLVTFAKPEEEIRDLCRLPKGYDVIITISAGEAALARKIGFRKVVYIGDFRVGVWVLDKSDITAEKVRRSCILELRRIFKAYERSPGGVLSLAKKINEKEDDRPGSPPLYHSIMRIQTWEYE